MVTAFLRGHVLAAWVAMFIFGPLFWMLLDRAPPYLLSSGVTVPAEIKRGGKFRIEWHLESFQRQCEGTVYRYLIDSDNKIWAHPVTPSAFGELVNLPQNKTIITGRQYELSNDVTLGEATIYVTGTFICNVMHNLWPLRVSAPPVKTTIIE